MKKLIVLALLIGCGIKHKISGKIDPVDVNVNHKIDLTSLSEYFKEQCRVKLSEGGYSPTKEEIDQCVSDSVFDFLEALETAGG